MQAPRRAQVEPALASHRGVGADTVWAIHQGDRGDAAEVGVGLVNIVDVERKVVSADVAVGRRGAPLVGAGVLEKLDVHGAAEADHVESAGCVRMDVEPAFHGFWPADRPVGVDQLPAQVFGEEAQGFVQVWDGEGDVVHTAQRRYPRLVVWGTAHLYSRHTAACRLAAMCTVPPPVSRPPERITPTRTLALRWRPCERRVRVFARRRPSRDAEDR